MLEYVGISSLTYTRMNENGRMIRKTVNEFKVSNKVCACNYYCDKISIISQVCVRLF